MRPIPLLLILTCAVSCKLDEERWPAKIAKAECKFAERCNAASFYYNYRDVDTCVEHELRIWEEHTEFYEKDCIFDRDQARDCLDALNRRCKSAGREYDQLFAACFEVWDCGVQELDEDNLPL